MIEATIALGKGTLEVLGLLVSTSADGRGLWNRTTTRRILEALRELYFYDNRTLSILEHTINGEERRKMSANCGRGPALAQC